MLQNRFDCELFFAVEVVKQFLRWYTEGRGNCWMFNRPCPNIFALQQLMIQKRMLYDCKAVARLHEALEEYKGSPSDTMRDGVIRRFEFAAELAWKACREYLADLGHAEVNRPKPVMRKLLRTA